MCTRNDIEFLCVRTCTSITINNRENSRIESFVRGWLCTRHIDECGEWRAMRAEATVGKWSFSLVRFNCCDEQVSPFIDMFIDKTRSRFAFKSTLATCTHSIPFVSLPPPIPCYFLIPLFPPTYPPPPNLS